MVKLWPSDETCVVGVVGLGADGGGVAGVVGGVVGGVAGAAGGVVGAAGPGGGVNVVKSG